MLYWIIPLGLLVILFILAYAKRVQMLKSIENTEPSPNIINLSDKDFNQHIKKGVTVVDCYADWCMPCKVLSPVINEIADELAGSVKVCKLDVDANKSTAAKLGIRSIPTILIYKDGKPEQKINGVKTKSGLLKEIKRYL